VQSVLKADDDKVDDVITVLWGARFSISMRTQVAVSGRMTKEKALQAAQAFMGGNEPRLSRRATAWMVELSALDGWVCVRTRRLCPLQSMMFTWSSKTSGMIWGTRLGRAHLFVSWPIHRLRPPARAATSRPKPDRHRPSSLGAPGISYLLKLISS
jgi:hypothetical protein